jgi:hypothetical protein
MSVRGQWTAWRDDWEGLPERWAAVQCPQAAVRSTNGAEPFIAANHPRVLLGRPARRRRERSYAARACRLVGSAAEYESR